MNVMLVDDEAKFITMLANRLRLRGIDATTATDGETALKLAARTRFDVAVLDIKMPGISGPRLKEKLSAINPEQKFIFVTGHGSPDEPDSLHPVHDIHLSKPLNIDILIETIKALVPTGETAGNGPEKEQP